MIDMIKFIIIYHLNINFHFNSHRKYYFIEASVKFLNVCDL